VHVLRLVFLPLIVGILDNGPPDKSTPVTPVIEQNAVGEVLAFGGDHDHVMLARRRLEGFGPVKLQRFPPFLRQAKQEPFGPLETEAAFPGARVDEEVVVTRGPDDAPFAL
jgi:hypothetical protein